MKRELTFNKDSVNYLNSILKRKIYKGLIVVTGQNIITGGPWTILNDSIDHLAAYKKDFLIIVILFKRLEKKHENVINIICKDSKKSWIHRFIYEKFKFNKFSKSLINNIDLWVSMHDITPIVKAKKIITYYHNVSPFWKPKFYQIFLSPVTAIFKLFYLRICQLNIYKNDALIVQQNWIKNKLLKKFPNLNIIICKPITNKKIKHNHFEKKTKSIEKYEKYFNKPFLLCPSTPRVFKNIETAIRAIKNLKKYNLLITISGNENIYTRYLKLLYSKIDNIFFIGYIDKDILELFYENSDAIIFPSQLESWGLPISESIQFKKIIFLPDLEYSRETCGNYDNAIFFSSGSYLELRNKIINKLLKENKEDTIKKNNKNLDKIKPYNWNNLWPKIV